MYKNELLLVQKARKLANSKNKYSKENAAEDYSQNKEAIKEKSTERYKNLSQEKKDKIQEYQKKKREREKRLKFNDIRLHQKEFHKSKQSVT